MGRNKKVLTIDAAKMLSMSNEEKLYVLQLTQQIIYYEAANIPEYVLEISCSDKPEIIAKRFYEIQGFQVFTSKIDGGYRCIGTEVFWTQFKEKQSDENKEIIKAIQRAINAEEFIELVNAIKTKNGTPDLLLIKDSKISFVEVKSNNETIKESSVRFFLQYSHKWPLEILRIVNK